MQHADYLLGSFWNLAFQITQQPIELPAVDTPSRGTAFAFMGLLLLIVYSSVSYLIMSNDKRNSLHSQSNRLGSMVAVFRYSPVDILSVNLPSSVLDFAYPKAQDWVIKEAVDVCLC